MNILNIDTCNNVYPYECIHIHLYNTIIMKILNTSIINLNSIMLMITMF